MQLLGTVVFLCGCLCFNYLNLIPSNHILIIFAVTSVLSSIALFKLSRVISIAIFLFSVGFFWTYLQAHAVLKHALLPELEGKNLVVEGIVASIPEQNAGMTRFEFDINTVYSENQKWQSPGKVRLSWQGETPLLWVGSSWRLEIRLKRPHSLSNPGSFDQEQWDFAHRIRANGYVLNSRDNQSLGFSQINYRLQRWRQAIFFEIETLLQGREYRGFITALTVGIRNSISSNQWEDLRNTGTNHLMAIAGLHIGFIVVFVNGLLRKIWKRSNRLCLLFPAPKAAASGALVAAIIYSALAGFALPTQRAIIMLGIHLLGIIFDRPIKLLQTTLTALVIILLIDPLTILTDSFWMSFLAVAAILYGMSGRLKKDSLWWKYGRVQWVIGVGLIPLSLLFFQQISLIGIFVNFIAIPVVGFLILPICWLSLLSLHFSKVFTQDLLLLANQLFSWIWPIISEMGHWPEGQWYGSLVNRIFFIGVIFGCGLWLAPTRFPGRWLSCFGFLPLLIPQTKCVPYHNYELTILDVGQGLATVVQTQHHVLVFDTGAKLGPDYDMGALVVLPFLRDQGILTVDKLIISHADNDHRGGLESVLAEIPVKELDTSVPELQSQFKGSACEQGKHWQWDDVQFEYLYPPPNQVFANNDSSCVLRISNGNTTTLLTGDIEHKSEKWLVSNEANGLSAQVLIAPHHGSKTSSSQELLSRVHPKIVVFSTGYKNRYHFPHPLIVSRYQQMGVTMYNTASCGEISFSMGKRFQAHPCYRQMNRHFWATNL